MSVPRRSRRAAPWLLLAGSLLLTAAAAAQPPPDDMNRLPRLERTLGLPRHYQLQLAQIDQFIQLGYYSRANALLEELAPTGGLDDEIRRRRLRIARAVGDHAQAAALCRQSLQAEPDDAGLWRQLAAALLALGQVSEGQVALDRFLALVGEPRSGLTVAVELLAEVGRCDLAVALVDSARERLAEPFFLARQGARCRLDLGQPQAAAAEISADLAANPGNLQLVRRELLAGGSAALPAEFRQEIVRLAGLPVARPEIRVLAANLTLAEGRTDAALALIQPRLAESAAAALAGVVLQNAGTLTRELPLIADMAERQAVSDYLQAILPALGEHPALALHLRRRACDHLVECCLLALEQGLLADDAQAAAAVFGRQLALVQRIHPRASNLYAAQIQLARFTRDQLRMPQAAATRLERLLQDPDLPLEGLALGRLTLGECYLAARDTIRARHVLASLGGDPEFPAPAGHAHFLLAKLDLVQGQFGTARDRCAAVALDNPAAPYANDALSLGLLIAEELQNPTGGLDLLASYARSVWWQIAAEPDSQLAALQQYVDRAARQVDLTAQQSLLEHARIEMAVLLHRAGSSDEALRQLERIVLDLPHGRQAARALALRGEILAEAGGEAAAVRREYERLLMQYPDYLFAAEIRQKLRTLP